MWVAPGIVLVLAVVLAAPFFFTTELVRLALAQAFPENDPEVGTAELSPSGTLIVRDLVLHDTGNRAGQPLVVAGELAAEFDWEELLWLRVRRIHVADLVVFARPNGPSQLSLLSLSMKEPEESVPSGPTSGSRLPWIDTLEVRGRIRQEPVPGLVPSAGDLPVEIEMTMSGERTSPSRRFEVALGEVQNLPEKTSEVFSTATPTAGFGLRAEVETGAADGKTRIVVRRLSARKAAVAIDAEVLRRYAPALPPELRGRVEASLESLDVSGRSNSAKGSVAKVDVRVRLRNLSLRSPPSGVHSFEVDRLSVAGRIESPLDRWAPGVLTVRDGTMKCAAIVWGEETVRDLDASWHVGNRLLTFDRFSAGIFGGRLRGSPAIDLVSHAMPRSDFRIEKIDMHEVLANVSPERLDATGRASGSVQLTVSEEGELSGSVDLAFDGSGVLRIGEIQQVKQMLVGNFGLDLANLAMDDLKQYPFREGRLHLESADENSRLEIRFVRQPKTGADVISPRKETINGKEVWVGSLVVPKIDMTIPITGKSLADILSMVSGVRPLFEAAGDPKGK